MKKIAAALCLFVVFTVGTVGCGSSEHLSGSRYTGSWEAENCEYAGFMLKTSDLVGECSITLKPDGKYKAVLAGESCRGKWEEISEGVQLDEDEDLVMKDQDGILYLDYEGVGMYFECVKGTGSLTP